MYRPSIGYFLQVLSYHASAQPAEVDKIMVRMG